MTKETVQGLFSIYEMCGNSVSAVALYALIIQQILEARVSNDYYFHYLIQESVVAERLQDWCCWDSEAIPLLKLLYTILTFIAFPHLSIIKCLVPKNLTHINLQSFSQDSQPPQRIQSDTVWFNTSALKLRQR